MILFAIENKGQVYVYGDSHKGLFVISGHLYNYNEHYVAVRVSENPLNIEIYDENKNLICRYPNDLIDTSNVKEIIL